MDSFAGQRAIYGGLGYREEARIQDFYQTCEDKVVFWKTIGPGWRSAMP